MKRLLWSVLVGLSLVGAGAAAQEDGDIERGKKVFKKCASCHMLGPKARNRVGPALNNILSAKAGSVADFRYSKSLQAAAAEGLHWTPQKLDAFLQDPKGVIARTKMSFRGLKDATDRADVIAYIATFSDPTGMAGMAAPVDEGFTVDAAILALEGDVEYGEYLGSECTACHQASGANDGIPSITGWQTEDFVTAMHAYKQKHRTHPVMQMITGRLSDEEIAALAAYFETLEN